MRAQYSIILFILCMNVACLIMYNTMPALAQGLPPITASEFEALNQTVNPETSLKYLNQTSIFSQYTVIFGDLVGGLRIFAQVVYWVVDGFPRMLDYWGTPYWISWGLRILFWFSVAILIIEIILRERISD